jgi:hypothetical protein
MTMAIEHTLALNAYKLAFDLEKGTKRENKEKSFCSVTNASSIRKKTT